ncbi:hypothetical protein [Dyadobacter psychrotolerans]|uniref:VRR-NUC domain-containing protein n=1 Tax=Dyadobacter psychrotolerans TaxID=2541721 RepID=A0A4R5DTA0_9BACT|nr:hypothetical protein [Dyadobacter psychrotolerans]TDE17682.1 hypothetical protein E0F88_07270 [Dyadobacter psychrotolerans]
MRRAAKADDNQPVIVKSFRQLGWTVAHTHMIGRGFPDIIASKHLPSGYRFTVVIEIKDGEKAKSAQALTPDEVVWKDAWQGEYKIINSIEAVAEYHNWVVREFG